MKKSLVLLFAILTLTLTACSAKTVNSADGEVEPTSTAASTETAEPSEATASEPTEEPTEPAKQQAISSAGQTEAKDSSVAQTTSPASSIPAVTAEPSVVSTPKPAEPSEKPPAITPTPTEFPVPPVPTESPEPKTAYDAPYNTAVIIADARAYGESIGMTWSDPLTKDNCSWEAPIQTSSILSGERLKAAIESGIRRVKKLQTDNEYQPGEFHFQLYLEPIAGGEYSLYWLMG